jgi:hypothetical protein
MATPSLTPLPVERIERLERQLVATRLLILLSIALNLLLVGIALQYFGFHLASRTIEVRKIALTDPAQHVLAIIGVDNKWGGAPSETYYPGIEFQDEKGETKMDLFGTGVYFQEGKKSANFTFTGLEINDKEKSTAILLNGTLFSYSHNKGQFLLFPHDDGLDLTVGDGENTFGVNTGHNQVSMYVASRKGELDIIGDESGTRLQRYAKGQSGR